MHGPLHGGRAFSTHQTSVENVKQSLRRNHVGLRKDYNTIYLEKHNVTPRVTSRGIPELLNHCGPFGGGASGGGVFLNARPETRTRTTAGPQVGVAQSRSSRTDQACK